MIGEWGELEGAKWRFEGFLKVFVGSGEDFFRGFWRFLGVYYIIVHLQDWVWRTSISKHLLDLLDKLEESLAYELLSDSSTTEGEFK